MKKFLSLFLVALAFLGLVSCTDTEQPGPGPDDDNPEEILPVEDDKIHLIILTGQSGARGKALNNSLSDEQKEVNYDVDICADGLMMPQLSKIPETLSNSAYIKELEPGFGDAAGEFGPELGMGETMASRYPKDGDARKSVIVKYTACGSTFTDHWYSTSAIDDEEVAESLDLIQVREDKNGNSTGPLTNNLYQLIDATIAQLEDEGYEVVIDGAAFVHGEQDAKFDKNMAIFEKALGYFIKDLRAYVGNPELPFVITEALTNSAMYSNELRAIQKRVADATENCSFISTTDLYTNKFEPWHFGTESNFILGNRIAAEIISLNDTRKVDSFDDVVVQVPYGVNVVLPAYLNATFTNEYSGLVKVTYDSSYDASTMGEQEVEFKAKTGEGTIKGKLKVNVVLEPFADGVINEPLYENAAKHEVDGVGTIYVVKGANGLYVAAKINDKELWTDGEAWSVGDMGQNGLNDDFRVYITGTDASEKMTLCLSSANLLRVYEAGTLASGYRPQANLYYQGVIEDYKYHVTTFGYANDPEKECNGMELELYISYSDLGIDNPEDIKMCFNYNNVNLVDGKKVAANNYYCKKAVDIANPEENDDYYFTLSEILDCNCES